MKNIIVFFTLIIALSFNAYTQVEKNLSSFLKPGKFINSDHPEIISKASELTKNRLGNVEKAKVLFEFVRDSYDNNRYSSYIASDVLENGGNLCYQRATLLAAMNRAAGIPSRLHLQKVTVKRGKEDIIFAHAVTGTYLNGKWYLYEPTGNKGKWIDLTGDETQAEKMVVQFTPDRNCLFKSTDKVVFENIPGFFEDWTDEMLDEINNIDGLKYVDLNYFLKIRNRNKFEVSCIKNIEVFSTLINLTDYWDKLRTDFPYASEIRDKFLPLKEHEAVKLTDRFIKQGWWQINFYNMALLITEFPDSKPIKSSRWFESEKIAAYLKEVNDFYKKSNYEEFWMQKQEFYKYLKKSIVEKFRKEKVNIIPIMEDFYGMEYDIYNMIPAPQLTGMGLHVEIDNSGKKWAYYIKGPSGSNKTQKGENYFVNSKDLIYFAFHEFGHSFLEPLLFSNFKGLNDCLYIYENVKEGMDQKGYSRWDRVFMENFIRAIQARLTIKAWGEEMSQKLLNTEYKNGYKLVLIFDEILDEYEQNRDKYSNFKSFFPLVFTKLDQKMKKK